MKKSAFLTKPAFWINIVLVCMEMIVLKDALTGSGVDSFRFYTIDSNLLQLFSSLLMVFFLVRTKESEPPLWVVSFRFVSAVCLLITHLVVLFVLAPQYGYRGMLLSGAAVFSHFLAPLLSVFSLIVFEYLPILPRRVLFYPTLFTFLYGQPVVILIGKKRIEAPYPFLRIHQQSLATSLLWLLILFSACFIASGVLFLARKAFAQRIVRRKKHADP